MVDGLVIDDRCLPNEKLTYFLFPNYDKEFSADKPYPYGTPTNVTARNIRSLAGREICTFAVPAQYPALSELALV